MNSEPDSRKAKSIQRKIRPVIGNDTIVETTWYFVEVLDRDGKWSEVSSECETQMEARACMTKLNCYGHKARIVQHFHGFRTVASKAFDL